MIDLVGELLTDAEQVFDDLGLTPAQGRNVKGIALACVPFVDAVGIVGNYRLDDLQRSAVPHGLMKNLCFFS